MAVTAAIAVAITVTIAVAIAEAITVTITMVSVALPPRSAGLLASRQPTQVSKLSGLSLGSAYLA